MIRLSVFVLATFLSACSILPGGKPESRTHIYLLETQMSVVSAGSDTRKRCGIVVVNPPELAPGHVGRQMLYQRNPNEIERFAYSRWAASPAVMLEPLMLESLRVGQHFDAVLTSPAPVRADMRIENDNLWLIQRFDGDRSFVELRMSVRAYAPATRQLLASRDFSYNEATTEGTPRSGVAAADRAVQHLLQDYSEFVRQSGDSLNLNCAASN